MFSLMEMKTGKFRTVDNITLLIMLRRFDDGYEQYYLCCALGKDEVHVSSGEDCVPVFLISKVVGVA